MTEKPAEPAVRIKMAGFAVISAIVLVAFARPIWDLAQFSFAHDLYSYIPLIPLTSLWLAWGKRRELRRGPAPRSWRLGVLLMAAGAAGLIAYWLRSWAGWQPVEEDYLASMVLSGLLLLAGSACLFLGSATVKSLAFPTAFLVFMAPLPPGARDGIEALLQRGSAEVAASLFEIFRTPMLRQGLTFQLPGIAIKVAPECSGIHSTLVLFITSTLAAYLFLRTPWKRAVLVLAVAPLALLRNGFRIFVIGQLCVYIGPQMIDSYIHRHGGPIFFVLSLIPFFFLLWFLQRSEPLQEIPAAAR